MDNRAWRVVIVLTLALTGAARAEAQDWGVKGGVNLADVKWGDEVVLDTKQSIGLVAGGFFRLWPAGVLSLQAEALVTQLVVDFSSEGVELTDTFWNLQVPVLARYRVTNGSSVKIYAQGGAAFDFVLFAEENISGETSDIRDLVAPWGASLVGAAEVQWNRWVFDVRYVFGLTEIYQVPGDDVVSDFPAKQRAIQITAGFRF